MTTDVRVTTQGWGSALPLHYAFGYRRDGISIVLADFSNSTSATVRLPSGTLKAMVVGRTMCSESRAYSADIAVAVAAIIANATATPDPVSLASSDPILLSEAIRSGSLSVEASVVPSIADAVASGLYASSSESLLTSAADALLSLSAVASGSANSSASILRAIGAVQGTASPTISGDALSTTTSETLARIAVRVLDTISGSLGSETASSFSAAVESAAASLGRVVRSGNSTAPLYVECGNVTAGAVRADSKSAAGASVGDGSIAFASGSLPAEVSVLQFMRYPSPYAGEEPTSSILAVVATDWYGRAVHIRNLSEPARICVPLAASPPPEAAGAFECRYYDPDASRWSGDGCRFSGILGRCGACECDHLTEFGLFGAGTAVASTEASGWAPSIALIASSAVIGALAIASIVACAVYVSRLRDEDEKKSSGSAIEGRLRKIV